MLFIWISLVLWRAYRTKKKGISLKEDAVFLSMLTGLIVFAITCTRLTSGITITDHNDNCRGGMLIAEGGVLYRDYVTQHMPNMYYLCAMFALLGTHSEAQFSLMFYAFESIIWTLIVMRGHKAHGIKKLMGLAVLVSVAMPLLINMWSTLIIADVVQGLMSILLLLEFMQYYRDRILDWKRCLIISLCIWASVGSAFVSIFPFTVLGIGFLIVEVKNRKSIWTSRKETLKRYGRLTGLMVIPPLCAVLYFYLNDALMDAYQQAYVFNRQVYPIYRYGYGESILRSLLNAFISLKDLIEAVLEFDIFATYQISYLVLTVITIINAVRKKRCGTFLICILTAFLFISGTRGYRDLHSIPVWYTASLIISLYSGIMASWKRNKAMYKAISVAVVALLIMTGYITHLKSSDHVSWLESKVVELTDEDEDIFIDTFYFESVYLYQKGRRPVNRATYFLPWYMDWFEEENIKALEEKKPRIVLYHEGNIVWKYKDFTPDFERALKAGYTQYGTGKWERCIWIRN